MNLMKLIIFSPHGRRLFSITLKFFGYWEMIEFMKFSIVINLVRVLKMIW